MKKIYWLLILSCINTAIMAQGTLRPYRIYATQKVQQRLLNENPQMAADISLIEQHVAQYKMMGQMQEITIPLVFHVLHNNTSENISQAQILSQIAALNYDFEAHEMAEADMHPAHYMEHIDKRMPNEMGIKFCLADLSQSNQNAINHIATNTTEWGANDAIKKSLSGGANPIQADKYLNIWIGNLADSVSGYAQMPGGPIATDGIVIDYEFFGTMGTAQAPYHLGRTLTHLVGSYLGLHELWNEYIPCGDDYVSDTPIHNAPNFGPTYMYRHISTCYDRPVEMSMNFMDNSDDDYLYMFSIGQMKRLRAMLANGGPRHGLLSGQTTCTSSSTVVNSSLAERKQTNKSQVVNAQALDFKMFPNPASKQVSLELSSQQAESGQVELIDLQGRILKEMELTLNKGINQYKINTSKIPAGIYLLKVKVAQHIITESLIIQN